MASDACKSIAQQGIYKIASLGCACLYHEFEAAFLVINDMQIYYIIVLTGIRWLPWAVHAFLMNLKLNSS